MFTLDQRVAIVTGGAAGIGEATVRRLAAAGAVCVVADLRDGSGLAAEVGGRSRVVDVGQPDQVDELVVSTLVDHGRLDIMVNNAGVLGPGGGLLAAEPAEARAMLDVNLVGVANGIRSAGSRMGPGSVIVNTSSMAGVVGFPGLAWYGAAKAGVIGLTTHARR